MHVDLIISFSLQTDPYGRISIMQFFNYVMRKVWLYQTRIGLALYDVAGLGYLKESVRMLYQSSNMPVYDLQQAIDGLKPNVVNITCHCRQTVRGCPRSICCICCSGAGTIFQQGGQGQNNSILHCAIISELFSKPRLSANKHK